MTLPASQSGVLEVQYKDGLGAWQTFGQAADLGTILRTRRFGVGPRQGVTAQEWRVVKVGAADMTGAVVALDAVRFWAEGEDASPVRLYPFAFDIDTQRYVLVATAGNIEVYNDGARVASIATPYGAEQVRVVSKVQALDTFLSFHVDVAPLRITRQGAHSQWDSRAVTFSVIPVFDYTGARLGGVNEVQQIRFDSYSNGETFNIHLEEFTTSSIIYSNVAATMIASLIAGLEALSNVGAGGVAITETSADTYRVEFVGQNRCEDIAEMAPVSIVTTAGGVFAATLTEGVEGGEAVISDTRGWPSCGAFYQSRLWLGGLRSRPQTLLASRLGDFFNFDTKGRPTAAAIDQDLDTDEATIVMAIYPGRHLQIFTSSAEFYLPTEPIVPPTPIKQTTRRGVQLATPQAFMDTSTIFVTRGGDGLAQFQFDLNQGSYSADYLNVMAPHLVAGVVDMAFRRARGPKETDLAIMARDDGVAAVMMALLAQSVVGVTRWTTQGLFVAGVGDIAGEVHVAIQRETPDGPEVFLERLDDDAMLDSQVLLTLAEDDDPLTSAQVPHLDGFTVDLYIDGSDAGTALVVDGVVAFPAPALRQAAIGCHFEPHGVLLPFALETDPRPLADQDERIGQMAFLLGPTVHLTAGLYGHRQWAVPLKRRASAVLDAGDEVNAFAGWTSLKEIPGFSETGQLEFRQTRPGPLTIKQIVATVDT